MISIAPYFLVIRLVSPLQFIRHSCHSRKEIDMFSLMFMMLFSLLPFPMLGVVMAVERLKKSTQDEP
jgi:hypothetical protein